MDAIYARIDADPAFHALARRHGRFVWTLAAVMFGAFFGFVLLIAFVPEFLAAPLAVDSVVTRGIPLGVAIIALGFVLTGLYVWRANAIFDRELAALLARYTAKD
jgi:uncharacterized membrane protein (DUF485 family)